MEGAPAAAPGTAEPLPPVVRESGGWRGTDLALGRERRRFQRNRDEDGSPKHGGQRPDSRGRGKWGKGRGAPERAEEPSRQGRCRCPGAGSPCGQGGLLLPAVISVLAVLPINSISACDTSVEGSSACHARLKQDPALPFVPSPVFFQFQNNDNNDSDAHSSFGVKAITRSAVPDNLSFLTVARSLSLMLYSIEPPFILLFFFLWATV